MPNRTQAWRRWQQRAHYRRRTRIYARHGLPPRHWMKHSSRICSCSSCGNPRRFASSRKRRLTRQELIEAERVEQQLHDALQSTGLYNCEGTRH